MRIISNPIRIYTCLALAAGSFLLPTASLCAKPDLDPTELKGHAMRVMETHCISCHGPKKQKGDVRLDALETIDPVDLQKLYGTAKEVLHFGEMPPEDEEQPSKADRAILVMWLDSQLTGDVAKALSEKLKRSEYGNVVQHEALFSGEHVDQPGYTPDRRWLISEYVFNEKINGLLDYYPTRTINGIIQHVQGDSGVHWSPKSERGNKFRRTITNPFLLPGKVGVRYYSHESVTSGTLLTMIGNAKRISGFMTSEAQMEANYPAMLALMETELKHREILRTRERFLSTYSYVERLLMDVYGDKHEALLPEITRMDIAYPGPTKKRQTNLGHLGRINAVDLRAIMHGIATHNQNGFKIKEIIPRDGAKETDAGRVDYGVADRSAFNDVILKSERDWVTYGVSESRIRNRVGLMKVFYDQWDMQQIYNRAEAGDYGPPTYVPLTDAEMATIIASIKKHRQKGDTYQAIIDTCMADWTASFKAERKAGAGASDKQLQDLIASLYDTILERAPTSTERADNADLMKAYLSKLEAQAAIAKLCESLILRTEFVYRREFGVGEADAHGRRLMSSHDVSYALAYALTDSSPDEQLAKAAKEGRLNTRQDYEREVRRMLKRRDLWYLIDEAAQAEGMTASVTNQPIRKLRFFREFFGYPKAMKVFKDDHRFGAGRVGGPVARLISEADLLVEYILEQDKNVFEGLLTTEKFYVFHSGENETMQASVDRLRNVYEYFKDYEWENWEPENLAPHKDFMNTIWEFQEMKGDDEAKLRGFMTHMKGLELQFGAGQKNGAPYMKQKRGFWHGGPVHGRTGQQMRGEQVTTFWNIDWRTWDYPTTQPAKMPDRKGMLTHPAWLIAHSQNLETDPIHRGKWVREKLLAGTIPDVPITVDAVIPPDHTKTLRQRMEDRTGDSYCWRCHQKMDPLGFPFERYDDFGRFRTTERLEHPDNVIKPAKEAEMTHGFKVAMYKTLPVDPRGVLKGTADKKLDGEVEDAFDMIDRLAKSERVRQSIIRHAFRYFMGRNEQLSDSKTLIDAERAYLESNGSFDELIVSLLTSDSFIYRKATSADKTQASTD